jgi:hypothetical protein
MPFVIEAAGRPRRVATNVRHPEAGTSQSSVERRRGTGA